MHLAGLTSRGLLEKPEFLARAREAKAILDSRPKFPDAERYYDWMSSHTFSFDTLEMLSCCSIQY